MAKGLITHAYLEDTADAIRVLRGESNTYTPDEFGEKIIDAIPTEEVTDSIVSVTDAAAYPAEGLEFAIDPVQDLHGYDKPWPAGGGKNKANVSDYSKSFTNAYYVDAAMGVTLEAGVTYTFSCDVNSTVTPFLISVGTGSGGIYRVDILTKSSQDNGRVYVTFTPTAEQLTDYTELYFRAPRFTTPQTGTVSVSNIQLELGSTATSYEPYSNICPISGWTGVNGERTGKNVWDEQWEKGAISNVTGETYALAGRVRSKNYISVKPNTSYYFCFPTSYSNIRVACYDKNKTYLGQNVGWLIINNNTTYTLPNNCYYIKFVVVKTDETYNNDISINYPATDTEYHAYTGTSIPITFPAEAGTVYGGKVDVVNGKLTVDRLTKIYNGAEDWRKSSSYDYYFYDDTTMPYKRTADVKVLSNILKYVGTSTNNGQFTLNTNYSVGLYIGNTNVNEIYIHLSGTTELSDLQQLLANNNLQLVYELATPIEYDITPQQVQMLLGDNNVWCDTGDTTLEYKVDLTRYIAKLQAAQTTQLSLSRQAVSLDAARDVEPITQEIKADVSERKSAEAEEQEEQEQGGDAD